MQLGGTSDTLLSPRYKKRQTKNSGNKYKNKTHCYWLFGSNRSSSSQNMWVCPSCLSVYLLLNPFYLRASRRFQADFKSIKEPCSWSLEPKTLHLVLIAPQWMFVCLSFREACLLFQRCRVTITSVLFIPHLWRKQEKLDIKHNGKRPFFEQVLEIRSCLVKFIWYCLYLGWHYLNF